VFRWLRKQFRYFFGFSKTEANGSIILIAIIILFSFLPLVTRYYQTQITVHEDYQWMLDSIGQQIDAQLIFDTASTEKEDGPSSEFDPNNITVKELIGFGLSEEVSNRWLKYLNAGGKFLRKEEVKKIYGLTDEDYSRMQKFIFIPPIPQVTKAFGEERIESVEVKAKTKTTLSFNMNLVDSVELEEIRGIGKVLSSRIIRFRNNLGGFVTMAQLEEVYGIEDYALTNLKQAAFIADEYLPKQLNINIFSIEELAKHPYVGFQEAKVIVAFRDQHGKFESANDLLRIHTIDSTWLNRVSPYLSK